MRWCRGRGGDDDGWMWGGGDDVRISEVRRVGARREQETAAEEDGAGRGAGRGRQSAGPFWSTDPKSGKHVSK